MKSEEFDLANGHWVFEEYNQNITTKQWRSWLLNHDNTIIVNGRLRTLKAENLGAGIYKISKVPLKKR